MTGENPAAGSGRESLVRAACGTKEAGIQGEAKQG